MGLHGCYHAQSHPILIYLIKYLLVKKGTSLGWLKLGKIESDNNN